MSGSLRAIAVVLRNPNLRRLQLAWAWSQLGASAYLIALTVVAFRSGGATAVGLIMLARMVASAIASPLLATLADRHQRRLVMAASDLVRAVLMVVLAMLVEAHAPVLAIYAMAVLIAVVTTAFRP